MKTKILICAMGLILFAIIYGLFLLSIDYGAMPYDEYYGNGEDKTPPCEAKHLEEGWTQLNNCAVYKLNEKYINRRVR